MVAAVALAAPAEGEEGFEAVAARIAVVVVAVGSVAVAVVAWVAVEGWDEAVTPDAADLGLPITQREEQGEDEGAPAATTTSASSRTYPPRKTLSTWPGSWASG